MREHGTLRILHFGLGEIGIGIGADDFGRTFSAISESHFDLVGSFDDMVVGQNIAIRADDHARSQTGRALWFTIEAVAKKTAEQGVVHERTVRCGDFLAGKNVDH